MLNHEFIQVILKFSETSLNFKNQIVVDIYSKIILYFESHIIPTNALCDKTQSSLLLNRVVLIVSTVL
jgi:hypothetical protein